MKQILIPLLMVILTLSGCSVHRSIESAETMLDVPERFTAGATEIATDTWWTSFHDTELNDLMGTALTDNLTIRAAWSRLEQARQLAIVSGAARYPSLDAGLTGQKARYETGTGPMGVDESTTWQASATVSWQLDLWRKIGNKRKAAILDAEASRFDMEATAQTIAGSVVNTWFALNSERATLRLLSEQAAVSNDFLDLVEFRFTNGLASALEVYQQRSVLAAVKALVPESEASVKVLENTLNMLLGTAPGTGVPDTVALPDLPDRPGTGVPATVLRNRPDVRSAELRLIAADHRLSAAIADRFPSLSLSYTIGGQSTEFKNVLDDWFSTLAGNLFMPMFAGGRLKAESERNRAIVEERYLGWEAALLSAWNEV
ncbi:MAG: efflux transporter outer membrane subunit, partial [Holophagae bacterium]|nr:efflux transporter outer membrane subunit [Holophagae bacterium]